MLSDVPALQVLAHRIVWSCVLLVAFVEWRRRRGTPWPRLTSRIVATYAVAAVLIGVNWFLYVWAVGAGHVLQTSLGYFITPLVSVVFGVFVFRERLRPLQWAAVVVAMLGMVYMATSVGGIPWASLGLAASFGSYSVVKKTASLSALEGLTLETVVLWLPAAVFLAVLAARGHGAFLAGAPRTDVLLVVGGLVTIVPLLFFASSLRLVPLSTVGILQYVSRRCSSCSVCWCTTSRSAVRNWVGSSPCGWRSWDSPWMACGPAVGRAPPRVHERSHPAGRSRRRRRGGGYAA
jgi:chloramphenicol-sensitive protein RarD